MPDQIVYFGPNSFTVLEGLISGAEYTFKARATNLVGDGLYSSQFTFLVVFRPSPPLNLRVLKFDNTYVQLAWDQPILNGGQ
jgi:hypothetical protein